MRPLRATRPLAPAWASVVVAGGAGSEGAGASVVGGRVMTVVGGAVGPAVVVLLDTDQWVLMLELVDEVVLGAALELGTTVVVGGGGGGGGV
jgi:hypothetical protein